MLTICVVSMEEYPEISRILKKEGIEVLSDDVQTIMAALEGEEILGVGVVTIKDDYCMIDQIIITDENDTILLDFGIGKALLNLIERRGIMDVYCYNSNLKELVKNLGFIECKNSKLSVDIKNKIDSIYYLNLNHYFDNHSCHKSGL